MAEEAASTHNRFITLLNSYYANLSTTDQQIADYISAHPHDVAQQSISTLADAVGVSTATVSRFVKRINFSSFREFSRQLASANQNELVTDEAFKEVDQQTTLKGIANQTFAKIGSSLQQTNQVLTEESLQEASDLITNARVLGFYGLGGSAVAALDGYHKFIRTGILCAHNSDFDLQLMQAAEMTSQDVAIVISHTGRNRETLLLVDTLVQHGVPIIAITSFGNSPLAKQSQLQFLSVAEEVNYRSEGLTSLIAQMSIIDSLFLITAVARTDETADSLEKVRRVIGQTRQN